MVFCLNCLRLFGKILTFSAGIENINFSPRSESFTEILHLHIIMHVYEQLMNTMGGYYQGISIFI